MELKEYIRRTIGDIATTNKVTPYTIDFDIGVNPNRYYDNGTYVYFVEVDSSSTNRIKFSYTVI